MVSYRKMELGATVLHWYQINYARFNDTIALYRKCSNLRNSFTDHTTNFLESDVKMHLMVAMK